MYFELTPPWLHRAGLGLGRELLSYGSRRLPRYSLRVGDLVANRAASATFWTPAARTLHPQAVDD